ncbi:helix-turn-helix domain-containing protein [Actinokineospora iranica]|uniref:AraC-type DNA-binding protein n=1 Tax=Actinokineospora iranica TaxID=1271860 RepID=A0A1G6TYF6_9PSEU|nr:helix-turn-helix domain-containing protein [Actinokineospora iranica]SDD34091.1 AraC-type DNA-binding protein [Actinokineospora iranica]
MIETVIRTADVPAEDRFEYWRDNLRRMHAPMDLVSAHSADFRASQRILRFGPVSVLTAAYQPLVFRRTPKLIRQSDPEMYHLALVTRGRGGATWDDHEAEYRDYDLHCNNSSRPCSVWVDDEQDMIESVGVKVPKVLLPLPRTKADQVVGRLMSGRDGVGALFAGFVTRLAEDASTYQPADGPRLGAVLIDLMSAVFAHILDANDRLSPESHQRVLVMRVRAFIRQHLHDPKLTPAVIAAAHHISTSYLHRLFQLDGVTVMAWIRQQRLEHARRDLRDPALRAVPVNQIAARWGFTHHAAFTRAFRAAFGTYPTADRAEPPPVKDA